MNLKNGPSCYACHLLFECDYLSKFQFTTHLLHLCWKKSVFEMKFKLVTSYPNMDNIMSNDMVQYNFNFHKTFFKTLLFLEYICVFEYTCTLHLFPQIYSNLPFYKLKWNNFFINLLPRLYFNIKCKNIVKKFQKFEVGYIQTCASLESNIMWHPKRGHHNVLSPFGVPGIEWVL